jgi:hypothetical protein
MRTAGTAAPVALGLENLWARAWQWQGIYIMRLLPGESILRSRFTQTTVTSNLFNSSKYRPLDSAVAKMAISPQM